MDRNAFIASVLIAAIMLVWFVWFTPEPPPRTGPVAPPPDTAAVEPSTPGVADLPEPETTEAQILPGTSTADSTLLAAQQGEAQLITVENNLYRAQFSTRGATLTSFKLKEYNKFDQVTPVQMVDTAGAGALSLLLVPRTGSLLDTRTLYFDVEDGPTDGEPLDASSEPHSLAFRTQIGDADLRLTYTFSPDTYEVLLRVDQSSADFFSLTEGYDLVWEGGIPFTENDPEQEALSSAAYVRYGGDVVKLGLDSDPTENQIFTGQIDWVATTNRFFAAYMIPEPGKTEGAELAGERRGETTDPDYFEDYGTRIVMAQPATDGDSFRLYIGPIEYNRIHDYDLYLYDVVDYGFGQTITRPISKYVIIPIFGLLGRVIPNYGVIIILFGLFIKLILFPLTKSSFKSMAQMRQLQPKMQEIKEKYGDDPQKQQEAMMKLYREGGVNPLGSCLPQLLQLPILYALFRFFPSAIEIRQQSFLWASDLSAPDAILHLPVSLPFYGDYVAGFTALMGVSLFIQMKVQGGMSAATGQSNVQAKIFQYVFPTMLIVFFNRFASGLSLYYLTYNIVTAVQQRFINKHIDEEKEEEEAAGGRQRGSGSKGKGGGKRPGGSGGKRSRKAPSTITNRRNGHSATGRPKTRGRRPR